MAHNFSSNSNNSNNMFLLEKRARGRNTSSITGKNWKWRTFKLTRQNLEYYNIDKFRGSYDMNQSIARECYTMECAGKKFAFTIQNKSEMFFLNANSEMVRQTCINIFNRSSTNPNWDNKADNQQALKDIEAKMLELKNATFNKDLSFLSFDAANSASSTIQRASKKFSQQQAELSWKIFSDLDTQDELEMLNLAVFMKTLIDTVPSSTDHIVEDRRGSMNLRQIGFSRDTIVCDDSHTVECFEITTEHIDRSVASAMIDFCRRGGGFRIEQKTALKIINQALKIFKSQANVSYVTINEGTKLTVVGDLHGQLSDLIYILDKSGLPSFKNKYIFNGDFVDRGDNSVEVVTLIFALLVAFGPDVIYLNRGNHEDMTICRVYGFESEVIEKYDRTMFRAYCEAFTHIPLASIINNTIFVVHGGLFHKADTTIEDIMSIERTDFLLKPVIPYPQNCADKPADKKRIEYLKQLQRDAMWSDPSDKPGATPNLRGAGALFGADVASTFMKVNGFSMVIRSHEAVFTGFGMSFASYAMKLNPSLGFRYKKDENYAINNAPLVSTVFSASNYSGSNNDAAIMIIEINSTNALARPIDSQKQLTNLTYFVHHFKTSCADSGAMKKSNQISLKELVLKRRTTLQSEFEHADITNSGMVTIDTWADIMLKVTQIKVQWSVLVASVATKDCLSTKGYVKYKIFLASFHAVAEEDAKKLGGDKMEMFDSLYGQRKQLEAVFKYFDVNGDGQISREEFENGCAALNKNLPEEVQLVGIDKFYRVMDFDGGGSIDVNEFFEAFRIVDSKKHLKN